MDYDRGDIILKSGLKFKGTDRLDFRLAGHPIVILKDASFDDDYIYFLTLSSQIAHINYEPDRYYLVKKDNYNRLRKTSIVDLKYIYKSENINVTRKTFLSSDDFKKMLDKMRSYDEIIKDDDFKEINEILDIEG